MGASFGRVRVGAARQPLSIGEAIERVIRPATRKIRRKKTLTEAQVRDLDRVTRALCPTPVIRDAIIHHGEIWPPPLDTPHSEGVVPCRSRDDGGVRLVPAYYIANYWTGRDGPGFCEDCQAVVDATRKAKAERDENRAAPDETPAKPILDGDVELTLAAAMIEMSARRGRVEESKLPPEDRASLQRQIDKYLAAGGGKTVPMRVYFGN